MTTMRIDHTGHNHPSTTAARTACRKAMKAAPKANLHLVTVGRGKAVHHGFADISGVRCGAGLTRSGNDSDYRAAGMGTIDDVTCRSCRSKWGHAHG